MARYLLRRLSLGAVQVFAVVALAFLLVDLLPGDAAVAIVGDKPDPEQIAAVRDQLRLDEPAPHRFALWVGDLISGDLGESLTSKRPVIDVVGAVLPTTLLLAGLAAVVLLPTAIWLGVLAARNRQRWIDRAITTLSVGLYAVPEFALAVLLVALFAIQLEWLPPTAVGVDSLLAQPAALVLPVLVLLARPICSISRLVRAGMIEALASEYVAHARRMGVAERHIVLRHALPNAMAPVVTQIARTVDWLLGGVIVVETVFVIPGLGTELVGAISARDLPVVQGIALIFGTSTIVVNLVADLVAFRLAPRVEVKR